jgi:hypothetical protein
MFDLPKLFGFGFPGEPSDFDHPVGGPAGEADDRVANELLLGA